MLVEDEGMTMCYSAVFVCKAHHLNRKTGLLFETWLVFRAVWSSTRMSEYQPQERPQPGSGNTREGNPSPFALLRCTFNN